MHVLLVIFRFLLGLALGDRCIAPVIGARRLLGEEFVSRQAVWSKVYGVAVGWMFTRWGLKTLGRPPDRYSLVPVVTCGGGARGRARRGVFRQPDQLRY